ncbi:MAG: trypsin-like peptidase domain-containing protein [Armatimonadetes bacterium]|nr:trypsin-like peptidase domain-containing protein [Armatimonadota bacterium]
MAAHIRPVSDRARRNLLFLVVVAAVMLYPLAPPAALSQAHAQQLTPTLVNKLKDAVVLIEVTLTTPEGEMEASGSGFCISPDGQIVTNAHVVAMTTEDEVGQVIVATRRDVKVVFHPATDREEVVPAKVLRENHDVDLALLKIERATPAYLGFVNSDSVVETTRIYVCGHPLGLREFSIRTGTVTAHRTWEGRPYIEHDASAEEGNSGGPVVISDGSVAGVHTLTLVSSGMLTKFAIPSNVVTAWLATDPSEDPPPPIPGKRVRELLAATDLHWQEQGTGTFALTPEKGEVVYVHEWEDFLRVFAQLGELPGENAYLKGCAALAALRFNYEDPVGRISLYDDEGTYNLYWEAQVPMSVATPDYLATLSRAGSLQVERWSQFMNAEPLTEISGIYPGGDDAALLKKLEQQLKAAELTYENKDNKYFVVPYDNDVDVYVSIWNGLVYTHFWPGGMPGENLTQQGQYAIEILKRNWDDPFGRIALDTDNDLVWESQVPMDFITPDYLAILCGTCATQVADFWEQYGKNPLNGG